jgi:hypothetical protein
MLFLVNYDPALIDSTRALLKMDSVLGQPTQVKELPLSETMARRSGFGMLRGTKLVKDCLLTY